MFSVLFAILTPWCLDAPGIVFPVIVKPAAACGIPGSHRHALVFSVLGLQDLQVGRPACIQEYVCHGGVQHKVYVAGNKVRKLSHDDPLCCCILANIHKHIRLCSYWYVSYIIIWYTVYFLFHGLRDGPTQPVVTKRSPMY